MSSNPIPRSQKHRKQVFGPNDLERFLDVGRFCHEVLLREAERGRQMFSAHLANNAIECITDIQGEWKLQESSVLRLDPANRLDRHVIDMLAGEEGNDLIDKHLLGGASNCSFFAYCHVACFKVSPILTGLSVSLAGFISVVGSSASLFILSSLSVLHTNQVLYVLYEHGVLILPIFCRGGPPSV